MTSVAASTSFLVPPSKDIPSPIVAAEILASLCQTAKPPVIITASVTSTAAKIDEVTHKICYSPGELKVHFDVDLYQMMDSLHEKEIQADYLWESRPFFSKETIENFKNKKKVNKKEVIEVIDLNAAFTFFRGSEEEAIQKLKPIVAFQKVDGTLFFRIRDVERIALDSSQRRMSATSSSTSSTASYGIATTSTAATLTTSRKRKSSLIQNVYTAMEARNNYLGNYKFTCAKKDGLMPDFISSSQCQFFSKLTLDRFKYGKQGDAETTNRIPVISLQKAAQKLGISERSVQARFTPAFSHPKEGVYFRSEDIEPVPEASTTSSSERPSKKRKTK